MRRSEINTIMEEATEFIHEHGFVLPPFGYWTPAYWASKGPECIEIVDNMLGWDITDFGSGDYEKIGLLMFTLRNGNFNKEAYPKAYAEKLLISKEGQVTPFHFHWSKMEDIINRGGGNLVIECWNSDPDGKRLDTDVQLHVDGTVITGKAGMRLTLHPGESITLLPYQYHAFWGEKGSGPVLIGEVSSVNDDRVDNRFLEKTGRFPEIIEDETPLHYLCNEYPKLG